MENSKHPRDAIDPKYIPDAVRVANAKKNGEKLRGTLFTDWLNKGSAKYYYDTHPEINPKTGEKIDGPQMK